MPAEHTELDIILRWVEDAAGFDVTLIYDHPDDPEDHQEFVEARLMFDTELLVDSVGNEETYARNLSAMMFQPLQMRDFINRALAVAGSMPVHLRLLIDPRAPLPYQLIRWESLRDPSGTFRLTTREGVRFSRYLSGPDWRGVTPLARKGKLRALVAVASPADLADYIPPGAARALAYIDVDAELERARKALEHTQVAVLPDGNGRRATLPNIIDGLREGIDVLYLVCHGNIENEVPQLYLEDKDGDLEKVAGRAFANRIGDLEHLPAIVAMCSCQSAGPGDLANPADKGSLAATGPLLAESGVAVVVAMQGNITQSTAAKLLPKFFNELDRDGLPDRAMAVARGFVSDQQDWWMPVLFSRLKRGRAWYLPKFGGREKVKFRDLRTRIENQGCTPVLGSGLNGEGILLSREELAEDWVQRRQMPISATSRGDLAKVAQYLSVDSGADMPRNELARYLRSYLRKTYAADLPDIGWERLSLQDIISAVGKHAREATGPSDPHAILASLKLPLYVTTSWTNLLEDALDDAGRTPSVGYFDWRAQRHEESRLPDATIEKPLVYHLFGTIERPRSLVLTEDDYFAWLRAWIKQVDKGDHIPGDVKPALTEGSLLFLGYGLDDWEFRFVFQSIKSFEANRSMRDRAHIGVQLRPETTTIDREAAQEFLENYFGGDAVEIYWGSCTQFLQDLRESEREDD